MHKLEYLPQTSRSPEHEPESKPTLQDLVERCNHIMADIFLYGLVLCGSQLFTVWLVAQILAKVG